MQDNSQAIYRAVIVPALNRIQAAHGYLQRAAMEQFARENKLPLYRLQAVASFFPHYRLTPPPKVTLHICRDMTCHMNGSGRLIGDLADLKSENVVIEGTSCLGRCDRAPAACVSIHRGADNTTGNGNGNGHGAIAEGRAEYGEEDRYLAQCSEEKLRGVVAAALAGKNISADLDVQIAEAGNTMARCPSADWMIDPYRPSPPDYAAVKKLLAAKRESLRHATEILQEKLKWTAARSQQFRTAADRRLLVGFPVDKELADEIRAWQTCDDWAKEPGLGDWADAFFQEMDSAHADLRGLGGAGIPATQKWKDVRDAVRTARRRMAEDDRAFIVVNGDESEPGTFKDRELLLHFPHLVIEGLLLAAIATDASQGFIYIRHEYPEQIAACQKEIARALGRNGPLADAFGHGSFPVSVFVSPGGYICGEQSALIEAMSDRRGEPRNLPPKLETNGLLDRPTLVSNVETFAWVPYIFLKGGQNYADLGVNDWRGRRFFSVSGDVNRPGVYEVPMGLTLRELIHGEQYCRGMANGRPLKAIAPSGPSGGFLPARLTAASGLPRNHTKNKVWQELSKRRGNDPAATELDVLDLELELNVFRALSPTQALGAGIVVYAEGRDMADQAINAIEFFRNESCGKCVPCRVGSQKLATLGSNLLDKRISAVQWKEEIAPLANELGETMALASICGLGRSVPTPLKTVADYFNADLETYLRPDDSAVNITTESRLSSEVHG